MLKVEWKKVVGIWFKTVLKDLTPIFLQSITDLFSELVETYNKDTIAKLKELKEKGEYILYNQEKKLNGQTYDNKIEEV